jgi:type II secretory pathway pseudopilin PulG
MNPVVLVIGVVVGALVLVAIIGILAAIAIPNLLTAQQRARQKRTMADVRMVATALEAYGVDHESEDYPSGEYVASLASNLQPAYIKTLPGVDGWGTALRYSPLPNRGYVIRSAGADSVFEHESPDEYAPGATSHFDCDIVFANGSFLQYPEGVQSGGGQ